MFLILGADEDKDSYAGGSWILNSICFSFSLVYLLPIHSLTQAPFSPSLPLILVPSQSLSLSLFISLLPLPSLFLSPTLFYLFSFSIFQESEDDNDDLKQMIEQILKESGIEGLEEILEVSG